ncbi:MAG TPA: FHA domain-containing protein [Candidatus Limnocylindrales bacterium]|nr:FHA domain-containing protein [Candidatus Limnocylindrales bacterium]
MSSNSTIDFGLSSGQAIAPEQLAEIPFFAGRKSNFADKLRENLVHRVTGEPIRAAVIREFKAGDTICEAGAYGSTAFLILEGAATAFVPDAAEPALPPGRTARSLRRLARLFSRRTRSEKPVAARVGIGEVTSSATLHRSVAAAPRKLGPGDFFGIDTCINFHPREASVRAETDCRVVEMLRSVLDTVRSSGKSGAAVEDFHRGATIRGALSAQELFGALTPEQRERLAEAAELVTQDDLDNGVLYEEGTDADSLLVVASGTVKLSRRMPGGERILTYAARGTALGLEALLVKDPVRQLVLRRIGPSGAATESVPLTGTVTIGRRKSATIPFGPEHASLSRRHCRFEVREGDVQEIRVFDENTDNGTFVNGARIQEAIVGVGDRVTLAEDYTFEIAEVAAGGPTRARAATATALDNCEIVRIPVAAVREVAGNDKRIADVADELSRILSTTAPSAPAEQAFLKKIVDLNLYNSQNTLLIDLERCTRCDECVRACADAHDGVPRFTRDGPRFGKYLVTLACRSCTDPKCMIGCPVSSIRRTESLEVHIEDWCIGCGLCANNCPFGNINMVDLAAPQGPAEPLGPVDLTSGKLRATVCDLCSGLDGPSCVYACPHDAAIRVKPADFLAPADLQVL